MRLAKLVVAGRSVLAVRRGEGFLALDTLLPTLPSELGALLRGPVDWAAVQAAVAAAPASLLLDSPRFAPPIADGAKVLCLGLNYIDHAKEAAYARPEYPVIFTRYASSFVGHEQPIERPVASASFDFEAELVVVIGRGGRRIPQSEALGHVAGYTLMNDGSVRDYQVRTHQWTLGKNFDRSGSLGPEIVTPDELPPGAAGLAISGRLNGEVMQSASTSSMIFDVATTIAAISEAMALAPGDLIAMGTPSGVGNARKPQLFMVPGDSFEVEIERVGRLRNAVQAEPQLAAVSHLSLEIFP